MCETNSTLSTKMKLIPCSSKSRHTVVAFKFIGALLAFGALATHGGVAPLLLDDYSDRKRNQNGGERLLVDDKSAGSSSRATQKCQNGVLLVNGDLIPGRGVPAFISEVSLLAADGS